MIPDFKKLGFEIMGITIVRLKEPISREKSDGIRETASRIERGNSHAPLMAVNLAGNHDVMFISFFENYAAYAKAMDLTRNLPGIDIENVSGYLVDLNDETHYRLLSLSEAAEHLVKQNDQN